jgi:segregation and condensation protein B
VIKGLLERKLIDIAGRDEGVGRALLFHTTKEFLQYFGINQISDLPRPREIEELLATGEGGKLLQDLPEEVLLKVTEDEDKEERDEETKNQSSSEKEESKGKHE